MGWDSAAKSVDEEIPGSYSVRLAAVFAAWLFCLWCSEVDAELFLQNTAISIEYVLLASAFVTAFVFTARFCFSRVVFGAQVALTLFLFLIAAPTVIVERILMPGVWRGWLYGVCFLQIIPALVFALESRFGKRLIGALLCRNSRRVTGSGDLRTMNNSTPASLRTPLIGYALAAMPFVFCLAADVGSDAGFSVRFTLTPLFLAPYGAVCAWVSWKRIISTRISLLVGGFAACFLVSSIMHGSPMCSAKTAQVFAAFFLTYLALTTIAGSAGGPRFLTRMYAFAVLGAIAVALVQLVRGTPDFFVRAGDANNHVYGVFILIGFPFALCWMLNVGARRDTAQLAAASVLALLCSITFGDTGQLFVLIMEAVIVFVFSSTSVRKWYAITATSILMVVVHLYAHPDAVRRSVRLHEVADVSAAFERSVRLAAVRPPGRLNWRIGGKSASIGLWVLPVQHEEVPTLGPEDDANVLKQRYAEWTAAANMMGAHPLLGVGPANYQARIGEYYSPLPKLNTSEPDTQNGWLVLGASVGIVGMLALMAACGAGLVWNICVLRRQEVGEREERLYRSAVLAACAGAIVGGVWSPLIQAGTMVPLAGLLAMADKTTSDWKTSVLGLTRWTNGAGRRRLAMLFPAVALLVLAPNLVRKRAAGPAYYWCEAEDYVSISAPAALIGDSVASGDAAIAIPEGVGAGWRGEAGGSADYEIQLADAGVYNLWARTRWSDGCGNALFLRANNGRRLILGNDAVFNEWHWFPVRGLRLPGGMNRIEISNREDGVALDKILVTNDLDFRPQGAWEAVYTQNLADETLTGWDSPEPSPWWREHENGSSGLLAPYGNSLSSRMLLKEPIRCDFRLDCRFRFPGPNGELDVLFLYGEAENHGSLELTGERISLKRTRGAEEQIIDSAPIDSVDSQRSHVVSILLRGGVVTAQYDGKQMFEYIERGITTGRCGFESPTGGVLVESFDIRPVEELYYFEEFGENTGTTRETNLPHGRRLIGNAEWLNYSVNIDLVRSSLPFRVKFNLADGEDSYIETLVTATSLTVRSIVESAVAEEHLFPLALSENDQAIQGLSIRSLDREVTVLVDGKEVAGVVFGEKSSFKGRIEFSTPDVSRVEVKGLRRFYDGFGGCDGNNSASWTEKAGIWKVVTDDIEGLRDSFGQFAEGNAIALVGETYWENYDIRCLVRSSGGNGIGVLSYFLDDDNYDLIRWASPDSILSYAGRIEFVRRRNGENRAIKAAQLTCENDRWYELRRITRGNKETVLIDGTTVLEAETEPDARGRVGLLTEENPGSFFDNVTVDFF